MNFKKIVITGAAAAIMLSSALPAFATSDGHGHGGWWKKGIDIDNNANVRNDVNTSSNTGYNEIKGWGKGVKNSSIQTGDAGAMATVVNDVNYNAVDVCGCNVKKVDIDNNATVSNNVDTSSNTGYNEIKGGKVRNSSISTGMAGSDAFVSNVVNTNIVGGGI